MSTDAVQVVEETQLENTIENRLKMNSIKLAEESLWIMKNAGQDREENHDI